MSTRAQFEVIDRDGKKHKFWIHKDAYPEEVIPCLPDWPVDFEAFCKQMHLEDDYLSVLDYYYEISLSEAMVNIYGSKYGKDNKCHRGSFLFQGNFTEAREKYRKSN